MPLSLRVNILPGVAQAPLRGKTSPLRERMRREAVSLAEAEALVEAAWTYRIVPIDMPLGDVFRLEDQVLTAPWLIPASGQLTSLACAVCTVGPKLEARVTSLFAEKRASLALALDELGNDLLFAVSRRVQDRVLVDARRQGLSLCGELHPGDPGLGLDAHDTVLHLAQAPLINVAGRYGHTLHPLKSSSAVMGVGVDLPAATWSRCDNCPSRAKCKLVAT